MTNVIVYSQTETTGSLFPILVSTSSIASLSPLNSLKDKPTNEEIDRLFEEAAVIIIIITRSMTKKLILCVD